MIRTINADSRDAFIDSIRSCDKEKIVVVSDPPFNIGYRYKTYKDKMDEEDYYTMLEFFFRDYPSVVVHYPEALYRLAFQIGKFPEKVISWVYNSNTAKQHRDIAYFGIKPDMSQVRQPYKNPTDKRIKERIARGEKGAKLYDWWEINQVKNISKQKTGHPCQMPLEVMKRALGVLPKDSVIVDPFMGSGTTGVAVAELNGGGYNMSFIGIEIDRDYYETAEKRIKEAESRPRQQELRWS